MSDTGDFAGPNPAGERNLVYPYRLWYIVGSFILVVAVCQRGSLVISKLFSRHTHSEDAENNGPADRHAASSLKRFPLALVNAYRIIAFRWTFTIGSYSLNLAEVFITVAYIVSSYTLEFVDTTLDGVKLSPELWINRAGLMAISQLPLVTVLGSKNNLIGLITGISYEKLNYAHRMCARVVITLVWVHAGARLQSSPASAFDDTFHRVGITAAFAVLTLFVVSLRPVRKATYELFFFIHFALVIVFLACAYIHTSEPGFHYYIWPCFLFWGLDRFIRLVRLVVFNHSYFGFTRSTTMDGTLELLSPQTVKLRLRRPSHFHWRPGQTAYLTMPSVSDLPFEAHPFTIASIDTISDEKEMVDSNPIRPYWKELVFFIDMHKGFTKKLNKIAAKGGMVKTFVDGPYGHSPDLSVYNTSVLIAGGSGLTFTLPLLLDAINKASLGKSNMSRLVFIWAIRDPSQLLWISEALTSALKTVPYTLSVSIRVFVTSRGAASTARQRVDLFPHPATEESWQHPAVHVTEGRRPDFGTLLQEQADLTTGRMSVSVCGSHSFANAVKQALGFSIAGPSSVLKGGPSITLHVEAFGYA